jgi:hypothetical protein
MSPDISPDSYLIFHHLITPRLLKKGRIVKVKHPTYGLIIKKIIKQDEQGDYWLKGVNKDSITTVEMGAINIKRIIGIVIFNIKSK